MQAELATGCWREKICGPTPAYGACSVRMKGTVNQQIDGRQMEAGLTWPSARLARRSMRTLTPSAAPARLSQDAKPKHLLSA